MYGHFHLAVLLFFKLSLFWIQSSQKNFPLGEGFE